MRLWRMVAVFLDFSCSVPGLFWDGGDTGIDKKVEVAATKYVEVVCVRRVVLSHRENAAKYVN